MGKSSINGPFSMAMLNNQMVSPMAPQHPPAPGQTAWQSWPACDRPPDEILAAQLCEALHDLHDVFICTEKGAKIAIYSGFIVETWWKILENDVKNGGTSWKIMENHGNLVETWWKIVDLPIENDDFMGFWYGLYWITLWLWHSQFAKV